MSAVYIVREGTKRGEGRYLCDEQWSLLRSEACRFRSLEGAAYEAQVQVERHGYERGEPQWQCRTVRLVRRDWKARALKAEMSAADAWAACFRAEARGSDLARLVEFAMTTGLAECDRLRARLTRAADAKLAELRTKHESFDLRAMREHVAACEAAEELWHARATLAETDLREMREHVAGCEEDARVLLESLGWTRAESSDPYGCEWRDPVLSARGGRESRTTAGALAVACGRLRDDLSAADAKLAELRTEREDVGVAVLREQAGCAAACEEERASATGNSPEARAHRLGAERCVRRIRARKGGGA